MARYTILFSPPLLPSATCALSPGGVAVCAKSPLSVHIVRVPQAHELYLQGRALVVNCTIYSHSFVCAVVYGFAPSHVSHGSNEDWMKAIGLWIASLKEPALMCGDMNMTTAMSSFLTLCRRVGLWKIGSEEATTRSKMGGAATGAAIDHCLANSRFMDYGLNADVRRDIFVSDHYPICGSWYVLKESQWPSWKWPRIMKKMREPDLTRVPLWEFEGDTYSEWAEKAVRWVAHLWGADPCSKTLVGLEPNPGKRGVRQDRTFTLFLSLQRSLDRHDRTPGDQLWKKVLAKFRLLELVPPQSPSHAHKMVDDAIHRYLDHLQEMALKKWRERVRTWHSQTKQLYVYLRNETPMKSLAMSLPEGITTSTGQMFRALEEYWAEIESWPTDTSEHDASCVLEDVFSLFVPHVPFTFNLHPKLLHRQIRLARDSSPGPDGWSREELKMLPEQAWCDLLRVLGTFDKIGATTVGLFRRVPISKVEGVPAPSEVRPIDVFSMVLRVISSAVTRGIRPWVVQVTHPSQLSSQGGVQLAAATMTVFAETAIRGDAPVWGLSLDFKKLFNCLSVSLAARTARFMGLDRLRPKGVGEEGVGEKLNRFFSGFFPWQVREWYVPGPSRHQGIPNFLCTLHISQQVFSGF